jgi:hypothetical protein
MTEREKDEAAACEWLDGPGGEACLASDQSDAVPLLADLLERTRRDAVAEERKRAEEIITDQAVRTINSTYGQEQEGVRRVVAEILRRMKGEPRD